MGRSTSRKGTQSTNRTGRGSRARAIAALAVAVLALAFAWATWQPAQAPPAASATPATAAPAAAAAEPADFAPLVGNWVRPDGGYVLSVASVAPDGRASLSYFNPRPIRVGRAEARRDAEGLSLFVEFDAADYPGSTYTLRYDAASDELRGVYYQAVQQATYDVAFARQR
jgi:hypothetical protein